MKRATTNVYYKKFSFLNDVTSFLHVDERFLTVYLVREQKEGSDCWAYFLVHDIAERLEPAYRKQNTLITIAPYTCLLPQVTTHENFATTNNKFIELAMLKTFVTHKLAHLLVPVKQVDEFFSSVQSMCEQRAQEYQWEFFVQQDFIDCIPPAITAALEMPIIDDLACKTLRDLLVSMEQRLMLYVNHTVVEAAQTTAVEKFTKTALFKAMVEAQLQNELEKQVAQAMAKEREKIEAWKREQWADAKLEVALNSPTPPPSPPTASKAPAPPIPLMSPVCWEEEDQDELLLIPPPKKQKQTT